MHATILPAAVFSGLILLAAYCPGQEEPAAEEAKPRPRITVSKETTHITEPLDAKGNVDYVAALNAISSEGVTPDNNAVVVLLQVLGPAVIEEEVRADYFKMLGSEPPPAEGRYWRELSTFAAANGYSPEDAEAAYEASSKPWSDDEQPLLADWLKANGKALDLAVKATKRPKYFSPLISEDGLVLSTLLPILSPTRDIARGLVARAMRHAGEGETEKAWEDLLACYRLGRLCGQGRTLIDGLVGIALAGMANTGTVELVNEVDLTAEQAKKMLADLAKLPPLLPMADRLDTAERFMYLDAVGMISREGPKGLAALDGGASREGVEAVLSKLAAGFVDWNETLKLGNSWYDRMVAAMRKESHGEQQKAMAVLEEDLKKLTAEAKDPAAMLKRIVFSGSISKAAGKQIGDILTALLLPAVNAVAIAETRGAAGAENVKTAIALAVWRTEKGSYPEKLSELVPKYLPAVPTDPFTEKPVLYQKQEDGGYLLYSVGPNQKDNEGRGQYDEDYEADDIAVRGPAPILP